MQIEQNDNDELNDILGKESEGQPPVENKRGCKPTTIGEDCATPSLRSNVVQWTTGDNKRYIPAAKTCKKLPPAAYEINHSPNVGTFFEKIPINIDGLVRFPQANTDRVLNEIQKFWDREYLFAEYGQTHKRGIMMWGPPGGGKSCCVKFVMKDVIEERNGIVVKFTSPHLFIDGMRILREIEPKTPVVVLMEDIDAIIERHGESDVLNILDGVDKVDKIVFLATTNYPELLGARIVNRPSRFDKRFKIGHPNAESRMIYLKHVICDEGRVNKEGLTSDKKKTEYINKKSKELNVDLEKWVKDTAGFSIAHLKELFVAVVILGDSYDDAIKTLRSMKDQISSKDSNGKVGFGRYLEESDDDGQ